MGVGGEKGFANGQRAAARFSKPCGLALDVDRHLIVADVVNQCIWKVATAKGRVMMVAGHVGHEGFANGEGAAARFHSPLGITVDSNNNILVATTDNHHIWMIAVAMARVTTVSDSSNAGFLDVVSALFNAPMSLTLDKGNHHQTIAGFSNVMHLNSCGW